MAITDFADFADRVANPWQVEDFNLTTLTTMAGRTYDAWVAQAIPGVAPTTAVAPTRTTTGAVGQENSTTGTLGLIGARFNAMNPGVYVVCDRLSHQGGLSGTVTTAQTTNLPTAALTRYTGGVGVMMGLSIYTQIGSTATTVAASYTNQAGTAGRTAPLTVFGGSGFREAGRLCLLPLQSGDTGVRAVASVTVTATTGIAGAFGVTLFKPLAAVICDEQHGVSVAGLINGRMSGGLPEIVDDACLFILAVSQSTNSSGVGAILTSEW